MIGERRQLIAFDAGGGWVIGTTEGADVLGAVMLSTFPRGFAMCVPRGADRFVIGDKKEASFFESRGDGFIGCSDLGSAVLHVMVGTPADEAVDLPGRILTLLVSAAGPKGLATATRDMGIRG